MGVINTVMIVDDSKVARMMTKNAVKSLLLDAEIIEADSGEEALKLMESVSPDAILMDINMHGISGLEAAEMILSARPDQKIAVCSANIQPAMQNKVERLGIQFVSKPIQLPILSDFLKS